MLSTRHAPRSSTVHLRAFAAAALALILVLALAAAATAAGPGVTIDSGPSGPTNDPQPTFGFTVDSSATSIQCSIDQGFPVYLPCSDTYTPALPLSDGPYTFRVDASDGVDDNVVTQDFTVDTVPPAVSIDSGPSGATNDTTPSFGFTAGGDATSVECSIDQGSPSYAPCAGTFAPGAPLAEGSYTFRVRVGDAAGNQATDTQGFTVDTSPPSLSIDSGPTGLTNDRTPTFAFSTDGSRVECSVDTGTPVYGSCSSGGSHTSSALADGSYVFHVRATDAAGNQSEASRSFTVDATPPTLTIDSGPAGATNDTTPTFDFTAEAGASVECSIDQGSPSYRSCTSADSHTAAALADGDYVFRVRATDAAGNRTTRSQSFSVDRTAPSLSIDSGPSGPTNVTTPSFGFTAEAGTTVQCSLDQGAYAACTSPYAIGSPLSEGTHTVHVRARDGSGNDAIVQRTFTVDTTPPSLSITLGPSGVTTDSTPLFGFAAERGATVECSIDSGTPAFGPCTNATAHTAGAPLADGAYVFRVRATDAAGNQTTATRAFTVDTVPDVPAPRTDPTPRPAPLVVMSPFPLVRITGTLTSTGARIRLLAVRAPRGALVRVTVTPPCGKKRHAPRRCRALHASATVGKHAVIAFRKLARAYRSGTVIVVRVSRADRIGKYTRFTIVRGKAPRRVDQCLMPGATRGSRCPSD